MSATRDKKVIRDRTSSSLPGNLLLLSLQTSFLYFIMHVARKNISKHFRAVGIAMCYKDSSWECRVGRQREGQSPGKEVSIT